MIAISQLIDAGEFAGTPQEWDTFVSGVPSSFAHHHAWLQIISKVYGGKPQYLAAYRRDALVGVLPLMFRRAIGAGAFLSSVPYSDEGGICMSSPDAEAPLLEAAHELGEKLGVSYIEFRQLNALTCDLPCDRTRVSLKMTLPEDDETLWAAFNPKVRNQVRKAQKSALQATVATDYINALERIFYPVYSENTRDLGSPMHACAFFRALIDDFSDICHIVTVCQDAKPVGAAIGIVHNGTFSVPWAACLRRYFTACPNNLLYWRLMQLAIELGCDTFDFGRSARDSGTYRFKRQWGAEDYQLHYTFMPVQRTPELGEKREGLAYRAFSTVWRHMPLSVARKIGPAIFRRLPL